MTLKDKGYVENESTQAWMYYELGKSYNQSLSPSQYDLVDTNIEFYAGNQWVMLPDTPAMRKLPKPVFNILKRVTSLFVASLTSSAATVSFEPLSYYDGENVNDPETNASVYATAEVRNLFEKFKMDYRIRDALTDGAITGDYAAHMYFDPDSLPYGGAFGAYKGEIKFELIDGINVMFGNPNELDIQKQPYVLIVGRDTVGNLKEEAETARRRKYNGADDSCDIISDSDYQFMPGSGGAAEIEAGDDTAKCTYIYMYTKRTHMEEVTDPETGAPVMEDVTDKDGEPIYEKDENGQPYIGVDGKPVVKKRVMKRSVTTVFVTKATKSAVIYEDVDTGLSLYPVAFGRWEKQKNQFHGRALITGLIPNQIYLNKMFALMMRHTELVAFPTRIYNADMIPNWTNEVGQAIKVRNLQPGQSVDSAASVIGVSEFSNQIITLIDKTMQYTKECLGATDAQMGNVKAENTSALLVLNNAGQVPLENPRSALYEWIEDVAAILLDMMGTYYGERPIVMEKSFEEPITDEAGNPMIDQQTGQMQMKTVKRRVIQTFDFRQFKNLWLNVRVDVGATSYYSELATMQTLDNLRRDGVLDVIEYLERVPDKFIPRRDELIDRLRQSQGLQNAQDQTQNAGNSVGVYDSASGNISKDKAFSKLTPSQQMQFSSMPSYAQRQMTKLAQAKM